MTKKKGLCLYQSVGFRSQKKKNNKSFHLKMVTTGAGRPPSDSTDQCEVMAFSVYTRLYHKYSSCNYWCSVKGKTESAIPKINFTKRLLRSFYCLFKGMSIPTLKGSLANKQRNFNLIYCNLFIPVVLTHVKL